MQHKVTHRGWEIHGADRDTLALVHKELIVAPLPTSITPNPGSFSAYMSTPTKLIVPYHWASNNFLGSEDLRPAAHPIPDSVQFVGALQPKLNQPEAVAVTLSSLRAKGGAVLSLHTGAGKTTCALYIVRQLGLKTLVVVHQTFLADQWVQRIKQFLPMAKVSKVQGPYHDVSGDIVIAMIQTLTSRKFPASMFDGFGLLCVDECHRIAAPVFSTAMRTLNFRYTLGLSATPQRKDGLEKLIFYMLGPLAYQNKQGQGQANAARVKIIRFQCDAYNTPPPLNCRGDLDFANLMNAIAGNAHRTQFVVDFVMEHLATRDVLILSHRRAHCETMAKLLQAKGLDAATYLGGDKSVPQSKIIVATFALVAEGFDEPRLSALVMATPASDVRQAMGRVTRGQRDADKPQPVIVDIVDTWGPCWAQASKRRKQYTAAGFMQNAL